MRQAIRNSESERSNRIAISAFEVIRRRAGLTSVDDQRGAGYVLRLDFEKAAMRRIYRAKREIEPACVSKREGQAAGGAISLDGCRLMLT